MDAMNLVKVVSKDFNEATGNYDGVVEETKIVYADISPMAKSQIQIFYGTIDKRAITARNFFPLDWNTFDFDYIVFRGRKYTLDTDSDYGNGITSFYFSEV